MSSTAVLVADLVESTALSTRLGDDAFERVLQEHDEVVADVVTSTHGRLVKFLGDGFIAAFAAASDALDCAEAFQQMTSRLSEVAGEPVRARVGVSLGDVFERDGDLHGRPMVEAARLCAAAPNGTILCTDVTHRAASGRPDGAFGPVQHLDLKGLPTLEARQLHWKPAADSRRARAWPSRRSAAFARSRHGAPIDLGGPKERRVLAVLAASANHAVNIDAIVDALWAENPPRTAAAQRPRICRSFAARDRARPAGRRRTEGARHGGPRLPPGARPSGARRLPFRGSRRTGPGVAGRRTRSRRRGVVVGGARAVARHPLRAPPRCRAMRGGVPASRGAPRPRARGARRRASRAGRSRRPRARDRGARERVPVAGTPLVLPPARPVPRRPPRRRARGLPTRHGPR